ncbi:hypothetical protein VaNZ11_016667, partial [Volvox africanus]
ESGGAPLPQLLLAPMPPPSPPLPLPLQLGGNLPGAGRTNGVVHGFTCLPLPRFGPEVSQNITGMKTAVDDLQTAPLAAPAVVAARPNRMEMVSENRSISGSVAFKPWPCQAWQTGSGGVMPPLAPAAADRVTVAVRDERQDPLPNPIQSLAHPAGEAVFWGGRASAPLPLSTFRPREVVTTAVGEHPLGGNWSALSDGPVLQLVQQQQSDQQPSSTWAEPIGDKTSLADLKDQVSLMSLTSWIQSSDFLLDEATSRSKNNYNSGGRE